MSAAIVTALDAHQIRVSWRTTWNLVSVSTTDGDRSFVGCGEWSDTHDAAGAERALAEWQRDLVGHSVDDGLELLARTAEHIATRPQRERHVEITVIGGIETALCDAAARQAGRTLAEWLGSDGPPAPTPLYANINRAIRERTPDTCAEVAAAAVADGFTAVKIAPFDFLTDRPDRAAYGLELARAVREAIGPDTDFMIDCHTHLTYSEMLAIAPGLSALNLRWLEDPFDLDCVEDWRRIKETVGVAMAGGEHAATGAELRPAFDAGVLDVVLPDVKHAGGVRRARELARLTASYDAEVAMHNPSGPVATAASLHAQAGVPTGRVLEYAYGEHDGRASVLDPPELIEGSLLQPTGAGLGIGPVIAPREARRI